MADDSRLPGSSTKTLTLEQRVGPRDRQTEAECVSRAEAALELLSAQFPIWLKEDVVRLGSGRDGVHLQGLGERELDPLFTAALDLKGLGQTYGFPT